MSCIISALYSFVSILNPFCGLKSNHDTDKAKQLYVKSVLEKDEEVDYKLSERDIVKEIPPTPKGKHYAVFKRMSENLDTFSKGSDALTKYEMEIARKTIEQYQAIDAEAETIQQAEGDSGKNSKINELTGGGAEGGFSAIPLAERIQTFITAYELSQDDRVKLRGLFACFSTGDTCLSNKTENLIKYLAHLILPEVDLTHDLSQGLEVPAYLISEILSEEDAFETTRDTVTTQELRDYFLGSQTQEAHLDDLIEKFTTASARGNTRLATFLSYLSERGIYTAGDPETINWRELLTGFIRSESFETALSQAREYAKLLDNE